MPNDSAASPQECAAMLLEVMPAVMRTIRARMRQDASVELTVVQFRALARVVRSSGGGGGGGGGGASISDVAEHVGLTLPSASKLVEGLVRHGYLTRRAHPQDRRITILAPTAKGTRALESARRAAREQLAGMLKHLPRRQRLDLASAMAALRPVFVDVDPSPATSDTRRRS